VADALFLAKTLDVLFHWKGLGVLVVRVPLAVVLNVVNRFEHEFDTGPLRRLLRCLSLHFHNDVL